MAHQLLRASGGQGDLRRRINPYVVPLHNVAGGHKPIEHGVLLVGMPAWSVAVAGPRRRGRRGISRGRDPKGLLPCHHARDSVAMGLDSCGHTISIGIRAVGRGGIGYGAGNLLQRIWWTRSRLLRNRSPTRGRWPRHTRNRCAGVSFVDSGMRLPCRSCGRRWPVCCGQFNRRNASAAEFSAVAGKRFAAAGALALRRGRSPSILAGLDGSEIACWEDHHDFNSARAVSNRLL